MQKKIGIALGSVVCAIVLGFGIYKTDASQQNPKLTVDHIRQMVEAQYPGEIVEIELDKANSKPVYEIEVVSQGREYEIKLDGQTGEVLNLRERAKKENIALNDKLQTKEDGTVKSADKEAKEQEQRQQDDDKQTDEKQTDARSDQTATSKTNEASSKPKTEQPIESSDQTKAESKQQTPEKKQTDTAPASPAKKQATVINVNQAIAIAQSQFNGKVIEAELEEDDGRLIYEIELENGLEEADIEIDAYTGKILFIEIERDDD